MDAGKRMTPPPAGNPAASLRIMLRHSHGSGLKCPRNAVFEPIKGKSLVVGSCMWREWLEGRVCEDSDPTTEVARILREMSHFCQFAAVCCFFALLIYVCFIYIFFNTEPWGVEYMKQVLPTFHTCYTKPHSRVTGLFASPGQVGLTVRFNSCCCAQAQGDNDERD